MNDDKRNLLECYKIAADFCGRTNENNDRISYNRSDVIDFAKAMLKVLNSY